MTLKQTKTYDLCSTNLNGKDGNLEYTDIQNVDMYVCMFLGIETYWAGAPLSCTLVLKLGISKHQKT